MKDYRPTEPLLPETPAIAPSLSRDLPSSRCGKFSTTVSVFCFRVAFCRSFASARITLEAGQRAKLDKAIEAACMEYFKAEKGEK